MLGHLRTWCLGLQEFLKFFHLLSWIRKNAGFQTPPPRGKGYAGSIISLGERSEARIWNQWAEGADASTGSRCLNACLCFTFSGSCLDPSLKGGPGITTKMQLVFWGDCKVFWGDERLEGSPVRLGGSPCLPPRRVCQAPHLGRAAPGALTPGSEARSSPDAGLQAARKP